MLVVSSSSVDVLWTTNFLIEVASIEERICAHVKIAEWYDW